MVSAASAAAAGGVVSASTSASAGLGASAAVLGPTATGLLIEQPTRRPGADAWAGAQPPGRSILELCPLQLAIKSRGSFLVRAELTGYVARPSMMLKRDVVSTTPITWKPA